MLLEEEERSEAGDAQRDEPEARHSTERSTADTECEAKLEDGIREDPNGECLRGRGDERPATA